MQVLENFYKRFDLQTADIERVMSNYTSNYTEKYFESFFSPKIGS
jgi:hypothetical protein